MLSEIDLFVNWVRRRNPNARTWKDYHYDLRQFVDIIGDLPITAITFREFHSFFAHPVTRGFNPRTSHQDYLDMIQKTRYDNE